MVGKPLIVVWFKRDLRLTDHAAIQCAADKGLPLLFLYIHEPSVFRSGHYSSRHERFVWESIREMSDHLQSYGGELWSVKAEAEEVFTALFELHPQLWVTSLEEVGMEVTYRRDRSMKAWFSDRSISWIELPFSGIRRGLKDRKDFNTYWYGYMQQSIVYTDFSALEFWHDERWIGWVKRHSFDEVLAEPGIVQRGGFKQAWKYLDSFVNHRIELYMRSISKPQESRTGCSRLSPYLAWGNISLREVYQYQKMHALKSPWKRNFAQFASRLRWREHFIQKFESQCSMEFNPINKGYETWQFANNLEAQERWKKGITGVPMVDACMRCLTETGYINFRMRAMLVSFLTHYLNESWEVAAAHLSGLFLDFEPGIHFPQIQMQAGFTGTNTIRIYNPTKQAEEHDPSGDFIIQWIPELSKVPIPTLFEPWKLSVMEQQLYGVEIGVDYPSPVIDLSVAYKDAKDRLWGWRGKEEVRKDAKRVLKRLSVPNSGNK